MNPTFEATVAFVPDTPGSAPGFARALGRGWLTRLLPRFARAASENLDRSTGLLSRAGLLAIADRHLEASATAGVTAVVFEFPDLLEVREIYGPAIARKVVAKLVRRLRSLAGLQGWVGRTGHTQFMIVFPRIDAPRAERRLHRVLGKPPRVEFDAGDSEIVLVPEFVVDTIGSGAGSTQELYRDMTRDLSRMHAVEMKRLHFLASERERHSRPMPERA